jgi:archaellum biogenesis protein FlaJ (TadC family)
MVIKVQNQLEKMVDAISLSVQLSVIVVVMLRQVVHLLCMSSFCCTSSVILLVLLPLLVLGLISRTMRFTMEDPPSIV